MEVVNLKLGNSISDAIERRIPQATGETVQFDSAACKHTLVPNQVYMLVGAKMRYKDGGESLVRVPGTTESTVLSCFPQEPMRLWGLQNFAVVESVDGAVQPESCQLILLSEWTMMGCLYRRPCSMNLGKSCTATPRTSRGLLSSGEM